MAENGNPEGQDPQKEGKAIRRLREQAEKAGKLQEELDAMKRTEAIRASGIDTESPLGRLFIDAYKGDFKDPEVLKSKALEYGVPVKGAESAGTPAAPQGSGTPGTPGSAQDTGSQERSALAAGSAADSGEDPDPRTVALAAADAIRENPNAKWDDEATAFLSVLATAATKGDERAVVWEGQGRTKPAASVPPARRSA